MGFDDFQDPNAVDPNAAAAPPQGLNQTDDTNAVQPGSTAYGPSLSAVGQAAPAIPGEPNAPSTVPYEFGEGATVTARRNWARKNQELQTEFARQRAQLDAQAARGGMQGSSFSRASMADLGAQQAEKAKAAQTQSMKDIAEVRKSLGGDPIEQQRVAIEQARLKQEADIAAKQRQHELVKQTKEQSFVGSESEKGRGHTTKERLSSQVFQGAQSRLGRIHQGMMQQAGFKHEEEMQEGKYAQEMEMQGRRLYQEKKLAKAERKSRENMDKKRRELDIVLQDIRLAHEKEENKESRMLTRSEGYFGRASTEKIATQRIQHEALQSQAQRDLDRSIARARNLLEERLAGAALIQKEWSEARTAQLSADRLRNDIYQAGETRRHEIALETQKNTWNTQAAVDRHQDELELARENSRLKLEEIGEEHFWSEARAETAHQREIQLEDLKARNASNLQDAMNAFTKKENASDRELIKVRDQNAHLIGVRQLQQHAEEIKNTFYHTLFDENMTEAKYERAKVEANREYKMLLRQNENNQLLEEGKFNLMKWYQESKATLEWAGLKFREAELMQAQQALEMKDYHAAKEHWLKGMEFLSGQEAAENQRAMQLLFRENMDMRNLEFAATQRLGEQTGAKQAMYGGIADMMTQLTAAFARGAA